MLQKRCVSTTQAFNVLPFITILYISKEQTIKEVQGFLTNTLPSYTKRIHDLSISNDDDDTSNTFFGISYNRSPNGEIKYPLKLLSSKCLKNNSRKESKKCLFRDCYLSYLDYDETSEVTKLCIVVE